LIAERAADESWETLHKQIDPALDVAGWIVVVNVSVTDKDVVFSRHYVFSGDGKMKSNRRRVARNDTRNSHKKHKKHKGFYKTDFCDFCASCG
jgi:hypothetical protein